MKKEYETPKIEIVEIDVEDIITTSGQKLFNPEDWNLDGGDPWYN